jgi:hypothetical protein
MSTLTLEAAAYLPPQDRVRFYLTKAGQYRKLAADAHCASVREALNAVARDFAQRARDADEQKITLGHGPQRGCAA